MDFLKIINDCKWIFAKTYENTEPHEYVVKGKNISNEDFYFLCVYFKSNSHKEYFYFQPYYYTTIGDYTYWVIGDVINRRWNDMYYVDEKMCIHKVENWKELLKDGRVSRR